jgi:DNA polymerase
MTERACSYWDEERLRLWHALGLGPAWRERRLPLPGAWSPAQEPGPDRGGWEALASEVDACRACGLCEGRRQAVLGVGNHGAHWMAVGEAPGADEDERGEPFVGQAGRLLDNMFAAIGISRTGTGPGGVYIANVVKCRPPANRNPEPAEIASCAQFLQRQIALVRPRLLLAFGKFAAHALTGSEAAVGTLRGRVHPGTAASCGIPVIVTWHPAYLLRTPSEKARAWVDLCLAAETHDTLDRPSTAEAGEGRG